MSTLLKVGQTSVGQTSVGQTSVAEKSRHPKLLYKSPIIVIIRLMLLVSLHPKVITLSTR